MTREQKLSLAAELAKQGKHVLVLIPNMKWAYVLRRELWGEGLYFNNQWQAQDVPGRLEIMCPVVSPHALWGRHPDVVFVDGGSYLPERIWDEIHFGWDKAEFHYL